MSHPRLAVKADTGAGAPTQAEHAASARGFVRALGLADCIHYASNWRARVDALYAQAHAANLPCGNPGLLPDGRMAIVSDVVCFFELKSS